MDVRDIAAVAVHALSGPEARGKVYTLTGPEALSYDDMAEELSRTLDHTIRHINLAPAALKAGMLAEGMPDAIADRMLDLERYFRDNRASLVTDDIRRVTGREARRFAACVRETTTTGVWSADVVHAAG